MNKIVVLGSINVDTILNISHLPQPGETMHMEDRSTAGGGKGANQALAAVRAGADTAFISKIGKDHAADFMMKTFKEDGLNVEHVTFSETEGTGKAYILLQDGGQNSILVYGGANADVTPADVDAAKDVIKDADCIIAQFEVPIPAITEAFKIAKENDVLTFLNPAPAPNRREIPDELLSLTDIIAPNETEAEIITGVHVDDDASMKEAAKAMHDMGIHTVLITVGSKGSFYSFDSGKTGFVNAFKVNAIDTTAAGDTFVGALMAKLDHDMSNIEEAMTYANKSSSITVQTKGAQNSIPYEKQIEI
ncbi:ribokinase [Companilactobacillus mishanensis]|uniref:Ribokinase n=1 Tax=Companilactobacillus mishanensis TaxID=2486008 RepID=A0ABW9PA13_9LACO|nr:ribokinase [Companilactobacillus mishanensis]MQS45697.1 ribokinase [Companilactobacillus mishanensis]MQS89123.1 ribokinase [Companilactobacillus mishanensis]